ncbi:UDP-glucose 4-epimerase GalE [Geodermatophilus arenarius]|uniref:UDP-glucose 4-epimerase n=1 Tax=Geodermatophilus arenarius TaxID=1137990 RepID=A0ABV9LI45_9ACTN
MPRGRWLVTGGAGYIGSHVVRALLRSGRDAVVVDDLSTGTTGRVPPEVDLEPISVLDTAALTSLLERVRPVGVVHLAGKKSPTESVADPLLYARENAGGVVSLLDALRATGGTRVVFSSSCSVYGTPDLDIVGEDAQTVPESPYGESKLYGERVLNAAAAAYGLGVVNLRYFNVVGAAAAELRDTGAYNLVPLVFRALQRGERPRVFGGDYPTPDGTCVRDYVDVRDLADAHVRAAEVLEEDLRTATYNVGRGQGSSVLEVLDVVRTVTGRPLEHDVVERRPGDPARIVGSVERIAHELGWRAQHDLTDMVASAWAADRPSPVDRS